MTHEKYYNICETIPEELIQDPRVAFQEITWTFAHKFMQCNGSLDPIFRAWIYDDHLVCLLIILWVKISE